MTHQGPPAGFGRYTLLDRLGSGGMADVYLALSKGPFDAKKLVVLKRPRATDNEYAAMFLDEARLAMRLNHPNVVQTYDVGIDDGAFFLAMEYLEGQPLHRIIPTMARHGQQLSHAHLARIASEALAGLHYAHELRDYDGTPLRIVHRDVSPHNIFVTYDGQVKVVDFGVAKATMNQVHTETGAVKGKLAYMAPEHATAGTVDRRSDVFAMGIILWELCAGRRLLTGANSAELLQKVLTMEFPPLSVAVPDVHPILEAIVMRALQRDPEERYQTALEMHEALESYIGASGKAVRASEIGRMVERLFAVSREQMATRVRAHMQSSASGSVPLVHARPGEHVPTAVTSNLDLIGGPGGDTNGPAVVTPLARPRNEWKTTAAVLALSASILALAVVLVITRRGGASDPRDPRESQSSAAGTDRAPSPPSAAPVVAVVPTLAEHAAEDAGAAALPTSATSATALPTSATSATSAIGGRPSSARPQGGVARPASSRGGTSPTRPIDTSFPR